MPSLPVRDPRVCRKPFDRFDHLTQAEVAELHRLRVRRAAGPLDFDDAMRMLDLSVRLHPPVYDSPPPPIA